MARRDRALAAAATRTRARLAALLAALALAACGGGDEPVAVADFSDMQADQVLEALDHWLTHEGVRQAFLEADTAYVYQDSASIHVRGVRVTMYDDQGRQNGELTSRSGVLNTRTEAMIARGDVVLITREGDRRIETEELHYDPASGRMWSDVATVMIEAGTRIRGTGFTADAGFQNVQVQQPRGRTDNLQLEF